ncbi:MAG: hypothetical protein NT065_03335 [Chlamydiae bacterium]|nr:hypothetical protein [Chlamydiota bacterium]
MKQFSVEYALLGIQSALLGEVIPALRAVFVNVDPDQEIFYCYFYQDGKMSEVNQDIWECVITEASADLGHCFVTSKIERLDYPKVIEGRGYCAYLRKEESGLTCFRVEEPQIIMVKPTLAYALLAVQKALLAEVTPELRSVVVDVEADPLKLYIRFYYDGAISEALYQSWESAQEKAQLYFGFSAILDGGIERRDYPEEMPFRGRYAYLRKE